MFSPFLTTLLYTHISVEVPDDFPIFVPFYPLFVCREHWIRLFGLLEKAAFSASFGFHHQVMVFRFHNGWLVQIIIIIYVTLITRVHIYPAKDK